MLKITGEQWNSFYGDDSVWGTEGFHDDTVLWVDGNRVVSGFDLIDNNSTVEIETGMFFKNQSPDCQFDDLEDVINEWLSKQDNKESPYDRISSMEDDNARLKAELAELRDAAKDVVDGQDEINAQVESGKKRGQMSSAPYVKLVRGIEKLRALLTDKDAK